MAKVSNGTSERTVNSRVTIADVARASQVSPTTVSLVLREKPGIGAATRRRVLHMAETLGYPRSPAATPLRPSSITNIGVLIKARANEVVTTNSFYAPILSGIEGVCRREQINLIYANLLVDEENAPLEAPRLLGDGDADGYLLVGMYLDEQTLNAWPALSSPMVLVDGYAADDRFDAVVTDNFTGAYEATQYLIDHNHCQIAIIGSRPDSFPSILERRQGYGRAMAEAGLPPIYVDSSLSPELVKPVAHEFLAAHPEVTAILACNDRVAAATMQVATELGKRLPDDLSIMGFDNVALTQHMTPTLTTMRVDGMSMGRLAAQLLIHRIEHPGAALVRTVIRPSVVERRSVARLARP